MVRIEYVDGSEDTVETVGYTDLEKIKAGYFHYNSDTQCFVVHDHKFESDCMMIPREFVKSIRHIGIE